MFNESYEDYIRSILGYPNISQNIPINDTYNTNSAYRQNSMNTYNTGQVYTQNYNNTYMQNNELENCYPEIYNIIYPMVKKVCKNAENVQVDRQMLENMTDEIYMAIEGNTEIRLNINLDNEVSGSRESITSSNTNPNVQMSKRDVDSKRVANVEKSNLVRSNMERSSVERNNLEIKKAQNDGNGNFVTSKAKSEENRNIVTSKIKNEENSSKENRNIKEDRENRQVRNTGIRDLIKILILRELLGRPRFPNRPHFPGGRPPFNMQRPGFNPGFEPGFNPGQNNNFRKTQ